MLDAYLGNEAPPTETPSTELLRALAVLSIAPAKADGMTVLPLDTGEVGVMRKVEDTLTAPPGGIADSLEVFGLDVFRGRTTQFQPLLSGPVPETYRLGAGDVLLLVLTGEIELAHSLEVTRDGFVVIPQVGQLFIAGVTMPALRQLLTQRLGRSYSGIRSGTIRFDVTVARLRTNQVFVIGEVVQPGAYQLASVATVLNAVYAAGGITERGTFRAIRVQRGGRMVVTFDLYDYLLRGETASDVTLEMGDVIFVGVHGTRASVRGAILRPAIYELKAGEGLRQLVAAAGGFQPEAALRRLSISRVLPPAKRGATGPDRIALDVPIGEIREGVAPDVPIEPGDDVRVFEVSTARAAVIELEGAVYHPGTYGWRPGLRLSELIGLAGGLKPAVYSDIAHINRLDPVDSTRFLMRVPLPADSLAPFPVDEVLHEFDIVSVFAREELRNSRSVFISGLVNLPGVKPYSEGMTVRDLLLLAGGLRDGAYLDSVEIARLPIDRSNGELARTVRIPLDSTYLFERVGTSYRFLPGPPARASGAPEFALEPYDRVTIYRQPQFEFQREVRVEGEVRLPGAYALRRKDERLSDVVGRSGGLLPTAFLGGASLVRSQFDLGRVNIDLEDALVRPGSSNDIVLQPGDVLTIPEYNPVVRVQGAVVSPTSVQYRAGASLDYYIENAGGWTRTSDRGRVSVRAANGTASAVRYFLMFRRNPEVGPGSVIVVGERPEGEPINWTQFTASMAQILVSAVAIVVVVTGR